MAETKNAKETKCSEWWDTPLRCECGVYFMVSRVHDNITADETLATAKFCPGCGSSIKIVEEVGAPVI